MPLVSDRSFPRIGPIPLLKSGNDLKFALAKQPRLSLAWATRLGLRCSYYLLGLTQVNWKGTVSTSRLSPFPFGSDAVYTAVTCSS